MTTDVQLQKAVAYCVQNGATVAESAEKFGVDKAKLSEMMSELMNPQGGGAPADVAQFTQNSKVAHATIKVLGKSYEIVTVGVGSEKGATARIYDENGMEVDANEFKEAYKIHSFKADHNTGEITVVAYEGAPGIKVAQEGKTNNFFDTFKNFWKRGRETANSGVEIVANRNDIAKAGGTGKAADVAGAEGATATAGAEKDVAQLAADYGIPPQDAKIAQNTAKEVVAKMSEADKADLAEKLEAGDYDGFQKAIANLASGILPEDMPGISVSKPVFYATLAVAAAGIIVAAAEAGAGAALSAVAEKVAQSGVGKMAMALFGALGLASCSPDDGIGGKTDIKQEVNITITQDSRLEDALDALLEGQKVTNALLQQILQKEIENGMTAKEILDLCGGNAQLLVKILDSMTENNNLLTEVRNNTENALEALVDIKGSVNTITNLIKDFPQYSDQLNEIINGIKTGNKSITEMKALIEQLLNQAVKNGDTQVSILNKLTEIENSNKSDGEKLAEMLKLLGEIKVTLDGIAGDLKTHFKNDAKVNEYLEKILEEAKKNNAKADETNALLQKLYALVEKLGKDGDAMGKEILNYIAAVGFEMNQNFTKLLDAIDKGNIKLDNITTILNSINNNKDGHEGVEALLKEILSQLNSMDNNNKQNFNAVLEALAKLSTGGTNADLSTIENLLKQLVDLNKANGVKLDNITKQNDTIITILKSFKNSVDGQLKEINDKLSQITGDVGEVKDFLSKLNVKLGDIINKLGQGGECKVDFDKLMSKLQEILDAIKDHKVEVDVTGKVTCECNCGNKHEGILGDLDDLLS